jgi:beta-lactamase class A
MRMGEHRTIKHRRFGIRDTLLPVAAFGLGIIGGYLYWQVAQGNAFVHDTGIRLSGQYKLVSPLLVCSSTEDQNYGEYQALDTSISTIVHTALKSGAATSVSVYFRGDGGQWVDNNPNEEYAPASLLKVPIMIAYYKAAESDPSILSKRLTYSGAVDGNAAENFKSPNDLSPGTYTVDQLINAMIKYSDNNAEELLSQNIDQAWLSEVYTDLGLKLGPQGNGAAEDITAKEYTYFFRILYNATYLTPQDSEKALELLTGSDFTLGLTSGTPAQVPIAQKFGERTVLSNLNQVIDRELHDCGIVYAPGHTYFLCIMTRGSDYGQLENVIQSVAKTVYSQVNK